MNIAHDLPPLIAHVVYRFDVGGLENGVVNLINHMPRGHYRHVVIALTEVTEFRHRVQRQDVVFISLSKPPGHAIRLYPRLFKLFRELRPAIVHTRNIAALEAQVPAWAAGVPVRIHGEHGRDVDDLDGRSVKHQWIRRLYRPFVMQYIALSRDLERYLIRQVGVAKSRVSQIYNGVDTRQFRPAGAQRQLIEGCPFIDPGLWLIGTVGRMAAVKDQLNLARAFIRALEIDPAQQRVLRLVMVGDGPLRAEAQALLRQAGWDHLAWLPGARDDIAEILRGLDCFVLPSLAEGISNTILEAMSSGLPVIATDVGGNAELVQSGRTGSVVPAANPDMLARAILAFVQDPTRARQAGLAGRAAVEHSFSLDSMVERYATLYDAQLEVFAAKFQRMGAS